MYLFEGCQMTNVGRIKERDSLLENENTFSAGNRKLLKGRLDFRPRVSCCMSGDIGYAFVAWSYSVRPCVRGRGGVKEKGRIEFRAWKASFRSRRERSNRIEKHSAQLVVGAFPTERRSMPQCWDVRSPGAFSSRMWARQRGHYRLGAGRKKSRINNGRRER